MHLKTKLSVRSGGIEHPCLGFGACRGQGPVHRPSQLSRRRLCGRRRLRHLWRLDRLHVAGQCSGRHQRRQARMGRVRDEYNMARGVECYERLKGKGASGNSVFMPCRPASPMPSSTRSRRTRFRWSPSATAETDASDGACSPGLPDADQLLVAEHGEDQVHRARARAAWTSSRARRSEPLSRLGLRQGNDSAA